MSDLDFELFEGKSLGDLFQDIYKNQRSKKRRISELIYDLKKAIRKAGENKEGLNASDVVMIYPIIKDLVDSSVKNDDSLIKLAVIAQRIMTSTTKSEGDTGFLSDDEKKQLLKEVKSLEKNIDNKEIEEEDEIDVMAKDLDRIKKEMNESED